MEHVDALLAARHASLKASSEKAIEDLMLVMLEDGGPRAARDTFIYHVAKLWSFDGIPFPLIIKKLGDVADEALERVMRAR